MSEFCKKCGGEMTAITNGDIVELGCQRCAEQDPRHLCDTCRFEFATCPAAGIIFGIDRDTSKRGKEADVVVECDIHCPKG